METLVQNLRACTGLPTIAEVSDLLGFHEVTLQSDVDERLRESRKKLDAEIKDVLHEASAIGDRALARARAVQAAGASAIAAALTRIESIEREVCSLVSL